MSKWLSCLLIIVATGLGQWQQTDFIIGSCGGVQPITQNHTNKNHDSTILADYYACGFNLIATRPTFTWQWDFRYQLELVSLFHSLKLLISDTCFYIKHWDYCTTGDTGIGVVEYPGIAYGRNNNSIMADWGPNAPTTASLDGLLNFVPFKPEMRNAMYGYYLHQEIPCNREIENILTWQEYFHAEDSSKLAWANLFPYCGIFTDTMDYKSYVSNYFDDDRTRVASFDYYPFLTNQWQANGKLTPNYFWNLQLFAQKSSTMQKPFWAYPYTGGKRIYAPYSSPKLKFMVWAPIIYGAKGLMYYSYWELFDDVDSLNGLATAAGALLHPKYDDVKNINFQINNMSHILMKLQWQKTIHGSSTDPNSGEIGLTTIDSSTPLFCNNSFKSAVLPTTPNDTGSIAIGIFKQGSEDYLMPMNKRIRYVGGAWQENTDISANYTVINYVYPLEFDKDAVKWKILKREKDKYVCPTTSFNLQISTGDAKLIKLAPGNILPLLNLNLDTIGGARAVNAEADSYATQVTLTGNSTSLPNSYDNVLFANNKFSGGFIADARVDSTNYGAIAGIMVRSSLDSAAPMAYLNLVQGHAYFSYRQSIGGSRLPISFQPDTCGGYLRIKRLGKTLKAYIKSNGNNYTEIANISLNTGPLYVGLCMHGSVSSKAIFSHISIHAYDPMTPTNTLLLGD